MLCEGKTALLYLKINFCTGVQPWRTGNLLLVTVSPAGSRKASIALQTMTWNGKKKNSISLSRYVTFFQSNRGISAYPFKLRVRKRRTVLDANNWRGITLLSPLFLFNGFPNSTYFHQPCQSFLSGEPNRVPKGISTPRTKTNRAPVLPRNWSRASSSAMLFCFNPKAAFYQFFSTLVLFHKYLELFINHVQWYV